MRLVQIICLLTIISAPNFAQKLLTLDEAINIALQRNTTLKQNENNISTYESDLKTAYGDFLPTLGASGSWGWQRNEDAGTTRDVGGAVLTFPPSTTETRNYRVGANSSITLFDGLSNFANLSRSKNDLEGAQLSLERLKQQIILQTINLYYNVSETYQILKVREEDVIQQQKNLETIEERNRLGAVTLADVYKQQVQLGNAELEVINTKNLLETAKSNLLFYLGLDVLENYEYSKEFTDKEFSILQKFINTDFEKISEMVTTALENRKDYLSKSLALESAQNRITMARSGHFPRLTGSLGYSSFANSLDNLFDSRTYSAGLTLSIPIFSGFSVSNQVQIAEVGLMNTEIELNDLKRQIKQDIQISFLDLQAANKELTVTEKNVKSADENLKIEQEKYNLGAGKLLDVLIANTQFRNALTNHINSQFKYIRLSEQLKYNMGVLDQSRFE